MDKYCACGLLGTERCHGRHMDEVISSELVLGSSGDAPVINLCPRRLCHSSNLNGFNFGPGDTPFAIGIVWWPITTHYHSLAKVEMAIKGDIVIFLSLLQFAKLIDEN